MKAYGYAFITRDTVRHFCSTKQGLLISYDLMALIGLRKMERRLRSKGQIARLKPIADSRCRLWGAALRGIPSVEAIGYCGGLQPTRERAERALAGFLRRDSNTPEENTALTHVWIRIKPTSKRKSRTLLRQAQQIIADRGWTLARMRFERWEEGRGNGDRRD